MPLRASCDSGWTRVYLQMDHSDQRYGNWCPSRWLDADGQLLDADVALWDELEPGADVPVLIGQP